MYRVQDLSVSLPEVDLATHLRAETTAAHQSLEDKLSLLSRPSDRQRFLRVVERFYGFHIVWEGAIRRSRHAAFHEARSRLPHLRRDLAALGRTSSEIAELPHCEAAAALIDGDDAGVLGSFYVLEGSTLGGQVISRAIAGCGWAPAGGLTYFNPYGPRTGERWREFRGWLSAQEADRGSAVSGARRTFGLLEDWVAA